MSQCRKDKGTGVFKYLLIFILSGCLSGFSTKAFSQGDARPQPPPHPKPPSLKEMVNKINIFKKHKNDPPTSTAAEPVKPPEPVLPPQPLPPPVPQPDPVKPKTTAKHRTVKKKVKKAAPSTDKKEPKTDKPQSLI